MSVFCKVLGLIAGVVTLFFVGSSLHGDVTPVVFSGQPAPVTNGRFTGIRQASVNSSGDMVFNASLDVGGVQGAGVFEISGGVLSPVALEGQALPDSFGLYFGGNFGDPQINSNGDITFTANFASDAAGTNFGSGLFSYSGGALHKIVDTSMAVPGMSRQTFNSFSSAPINDSGDVAFIAGIGSVSPPVQRGLFLMSHGNLIPVAFQPDFGGNIVSLNNHDEIVFTTQNGISEFSGGVIKPIVTLGQSVPKTNLTVRADNPWINDDGDIVFVNYELQLAGRGNIPTPFSNAILRWRQGVLDKIAAVGDPVPGIAGATFWLSSFGSPRINESGIVFHSATAPASGQDIVRLICRFENGQLSVIARGDQFVPGFGTPDSIAAPNFDNRQGPLVTFLAVSTALVTPPSPEGLYSIAPGPYTLLFPQIADGTGAGGGWRTTFILANRSTTPASATVSFYDDNGAPISMSIGGQQQNQVTTSVPALGVTQFQTDGVAPLRTGWAKVQSDQSLSGIDLFSFFDGAGNFVGEVGVQASVPLRSMSLFVQAGSSSSTGVAVANPNTAPATLTLILRDSNSNEVARSSATVPAMGHLAKYAGEIFAGIPSGDFEGKMEVMSTLPIVAITLRQRGPVFTSLPIIP